MPVENLGSVNPVALGVTLLMGVLLLALPRRYALAPVVVLTCYLPMTQQLIIAGLHFPMIRVLALFGFVRVIARGELRRIKLNPIDKALLAWGLAAIVMHTLLWRTWGEFINRLGYTYNAVGFYLLFRSVVRDLSDVTRAFKITAVFLFPLAVAMLVEHVTARNLFVAIGGIEPEVRLGIARARGPFVHPDLSGAFGATLLPLFVALWWVGDRTKAVVGMASSVIITLASGASGPVVSLSAAVLGLAMWAVRRQMRLVRWGIVLVLICLQLAMKAPVWWAIMHVSVHQGGDAWTRAFIIDRAIFNFPDWWLVGTKSTAAWAWEAQDITNQFVAEGVNGGLLTMLLFILVISRCFGTVGRSIRTTEGTEPKWVQIVLWAMGAALFAHVATFFGISYFDQSFINLYLLLAVISAAYNLFLRDRTPEATVTPAEIESGAHTASSFANLPSNADTA